MKTVFPEIRTLAELLPHVSHKPEIRVGAQPQGLSVVCYMFADSKTFENPYLAECRGIAFDSDGNVCSRPLHKFFNVGEKEWLNIDAIRARQAEIVAVFEKLDGSMIASAWVNGQLQWRSKKSFGSDVVKLTHEVLTQPQFANVKAFSQEVASRGLTVIFELMHPQARIVVAPKEPSFRLLHARDNVTGEYVLLNDSHWIHDLVREHGIEQAPRFTGMSFDALMESLEQMQEQEGYIVQFVDGDMVKMKCPWYLRLHRSITFLRERDIALSALNEELDDLKGVLVEAGVDLGPILEIEERVKTRMLDISREIEEAVVPDQQMERGDFARKHKGKPLFGLIMTRYLGQELKLAEWFIKNRLKDEFSLRVLADGALAEAMEG